jgi:hypothetical protein
LYSHVFGASANPPAAGTITLNGSFQYSNYKFSAYKFPTYRASKKEAQDYPQIRLAEVFLILAEATFEKNGSISDADLNSTINQLRLRAGVAPLTNALVSNNGLDMLEEIRRERTVELWGECTRFDDLKRWGIAERSLNQDICSIVVGGATYTTEFKTASLEHPSADSVIAAKYIVKNYTPSNGVIMETVTKTGDGDLKAILLDPAANRNFKRKHYLYPVPLQEIQLNPNLVQNNEY